jgi:Uncharacterized conserved protein
MSRYPKLVRDRIPQIIEKSGKCCQSRILSEVEYQDALAKKLVEEAEEYFESRDKEELADVLEVVKAILASCNYSEDEIEALRLGKREARGGFEKQIELISVENT